MTISKRRSAIGDISAFDALPQRYRRNTSEEIIALNGRPSLVLTSRATVFTLIGV